MRIGFLAFILLSPLALFAKEIPAFEVPADALLGGAFEIISPTGPAYTAEGTLDCTSIAGEFPPYETTSDCSFTLNGKSVFLGSIESVSKADVDALLGRLMEIYPPTGPGYFISLNFAVSHLNTGWAPETSSAYVWK